MIGMIVTGHGSFASGITSGIRLLAGQPEQYVAVDFTEEDSIADLEEKLRQAVKRLSGCEGILIYTDLTGGSPFNVSIRMKMEQEQPMEVLGGANLAAVLDGYMSRMAVTDAKALAAGGWEAGRDAMVLFTEPEEDDGEFEE